MANYNASFYIDFLAALNQPSSILLPSGGKQVPQPTPIATYLTQLASSAMKSSNKSVQETLSAKAAALQSAAMAANKSDPKTNRTPSNDSKKEATSNAALYENAEKCMRSMNKIIDDPLKLLKHELRAWKQRKKDIKGIFVLNKHKLKRLARQAGMKEVEGFLYNAKQGVGVFGNHGFPRPNFETSWKFQLLNARSFASVGHLLRILHCCLRWDVINIRPPKGVNHSITTSKGNPFYFVLFCFILVRHGCPVSSWKLLFRGAVFQILKIKIKKGCITS